MITSDGNSVEGIMLPDGTIQQAPATGVGGDAQNKTPRRTGSLALFFRKVYHLAHLRLDLLCSTLGIHDEDVKRKIWTVFEYAMRSHTILMKDRHMDQLLMCSLYIVCKVPIQARHCMSSK